MRFIILAIVLSLLFPSLAVADSKVVAHMRPLPHEMLVLPIEMDCGLVIREWRGGSPTLSQTNRLRQYCDKAKQAFFPFLAEQGLKPKHKLSFSWNLSIIPDGDCYRCMQDLQYRFKNRNLQTELWGYTAQNKKYIFIVNRIFVSDSFYKKVFIHEMFHAMSIFYGIFDTHPLSVEEDLAHRFTQYLGLGR